MRREARSQKPGARSALFGVGVWLLASCFWLLASLQAEVLDKIVAVVDGRIITLSDVQQESVVRSLLGETTIKDDDLLQQIIEGYLIESQLAGFPGIEVTDEEIADSISKLPKKDGITANALHKAILRRMRTSRYFDLRFRQFLRASDEDLRKYYNEVFVPEASTRGVNPIPALEQVTDAIRKNVLDEQLDHEVTIWLEAVRRRSNIEILK
jgi:parvulin-like peptidyl-prolyl isomerase